jgi:hypothetical protein
MHTSSRSPQTSRSQSSWQGIITVVSVLCSLLILLVSPAVCVPEALDGRSTVRLDKLVRDDFFAGMMGNKARLDRGMKFCEDLLATDPKHAEALVWHGGGLLTRAENAYRAGNQKLGDQLWEQGLAEMNEAVALAPNNMAVKIGRSATIVGVAQSGWDTSDEKSRALLESALLDYEKVYAWQQPTFDKLTNHSRGELLFGLASGWSILGNHEKARHYLSLVLKTCAGTDYESEAQMWMKKKPDTVIQHDCRGCHR